ncbi:hypothetical protein ACJZ2D_001017 [Fusarium nematophilum]
MRLSTNLLAGFLLGAAAHPGHDHVQEAAERRDFLSSAKRSSLAHCADKLKARGIESRNIARRSAQINKARQKRGLLKGRDLESVLDTSHNQTDEGITLDTDADTLFAGINSCVLTPEVTQGPYYIAGEYVREDVVEEQEGVPITLDYQVIDVETCDPVPDIYLEIWHCNATGVYSGIIANGNGDSSDDANIDNTWLRGIQPTNDDGVAQFQSIFPGHYTGRTTHIHIMVHANATLLSNKTLGSENYASHVGQAFFDQDLITEVERLEPYRSNAQQLTENADDNILRQEADADGGIDPVMEYTLLGDDVSEGLYAWFAFGVDTTQSQSITPAAVLYESGGVANDDSGGGSGGGNGGNGGNGGAPSAPSDSPSSARPRPAVNLSTYLAKAAESFLTREGGRGRGFEDNDKLVSMVEENY